MTARSFDRIAHAPVDDASAMAFARAIASPVDGVPSADDSRADICTVAEVARWLKVDRKTIYDAVNRRELPSARLGRRVLLSRTAITEWLAGRLR